LWQAACLWQHPIAITPFLSAMTHTALLVIDIQRGAFDTVRCPAIDRAEQLVANASGLVSAARESGTPVVFIQHCEGANKVFEEGSPHWPVHEALTPQPHDTVLKKYASSAFEGTDLAEKLQGLGARELVLCGLQSEFCVSNTARSALSAGYAVVVAQDGHSTWPSGDKPSLAISEQVNLALEQAGARLSATAELMHSLRAART